jgi:hypothetical protein
VNRGRRWADRTQPTRRAGRGPLWHGVVRGRPGLTRVRWLGRGQIWGARRPEMILGVPGDGVVRGRPGLSRTRSLGRGKTRGPRRHGVVGDRAPRCAATWGVPGFWGVPRRQVIPVVARRAAIRGVPSRPRRAGVVLQSRRTRRQPRGRPGRWAACAAVGIGPQQNPAQTAPPQRRLRRSGRPSRPASGAARPKPTRRRSRPAAVHSFATGPPWRWCRRMAPGRSRAGAASTPTSRAPGRRSRCMIRLATGRAPGRSRRWIPARARLPRTGPGRILTAGGGNGVQPVHPRRLTGTPTPRAQTRDRRPDIRPGQPVPPVRAAGPDAAGPAG